MYFLLGTDVTGAEGGSCALPKRACPHSSGARPVLTGHLGPSTTMLRKTEETVAILENFVLAHICLDFQSLLPP